MKHVYVVRGKTGSYGDTWTWDAKAYFDEATAQKMVADLNHLASPAHVNNFTSPSGFCNTEKMYKVQAEVCKKIKKIDPKLESISDSLWYSLITLEVF